MNTPEFNKSMQSLLDDATKILTAAEKEYASDADRLANFKKRSVGTPETVCFIYLTKHIDGIENYVNGRARVQRDSIRGRIIDSINYLILLNAIIEEQDAIAIAEGTRQDIRAVGPIKSAGFSGQNQILCIYCKHPMQYTVDKWICPNPFCPGKASAQSEIPK